MIWFLIGLLLILVILTFFDWRLILGILVVGLLILYFALPENRRSQQEIEADKRERAIATNALKKEYAKKCLERLWHDGEKNSGDPAEWLPDISWPPLEDLCKQ